MSCLSHNDTHVSEDLCYCLKEWCGGFCGVRGHISCIRGAFLVERHFLFDNYVLVSFHVSLYEIFTVGLVAMISIFGTFSILSTQQSHSEQDFLTSHTVIPSMPRWQLSEI